MHSPLSTQALAHLREASGPSPVRRMSITPLMTATGSALTPPGPVTGQTSTHLPQRVQASAIASTRAASAVSKVSVMRPRGSEYAPGHRVPPQPDELKPLALLASPRKQGPIRATLRGRDRDAFLLAGIGNIADSGALH